jgi:hypothetical protein
MDQFLMQFDRYVRAESDITRRTLIRAVEALDFKVDRSRGSFVEAHSGSPWLPRIGTISRPTRIRMTVLGADGATRLQIRLSDAEPVIVDPPASRAAYAALFAQVQADIDDQLRELDADLLCDAATSVEAAPSGSRLSQFADLAQRASGLPVVRALVPNDAIRLECPEATAELAEADAEVMLAVASMASADPAIPAGLGQRMAALQMALEQAIRGSRSQRVITLDDKGRRLVDFVYRQASVRQGLPVRELQRCNDCGQARIVNPELHKVAGRKRAIQDLVSIASSTLSLSSAFSSAGRMLNNHAMGSSVSCTRCQGASSEVTLVTICPRCRAIRNEPVLRTCTAEGCGYDFTAHVATTSLWHDRPVATDSPAEAKVRPSAEQTTQVRSIVEPAPSPGWYRDPSGGHEWRWFEGTWTAHVCDGGAVALDD